MAERRAEAVVVMRQVELARLGDVEHPPDPDRRIDEKPPDGLDRALGLQLQHVVGEHQRLADIREDMPDPGAQRLGDHRLVQHRQRPERDPVEELVDREHRPVETLERIALGPVMPRPRRVRGSGGRCGRCHVRRDRYRRRNVLRHRHGCDEQRERHRYRTARPPQPQDQRPPLAERSLRWLISAFAPPLAKIVAKSARRVASWLIAFL